MKTLNKIPTGKIERASNLLKAGAKVGVNYIKYYGYKITKDEEEAKKMGFTGAACAPMVRSSYWADQQAHSAGVA